MVSQITAQSIPGTNIRIGPDGTTSSTAVSSATLDAVLGSIVGSIAYRGQAGWTSLPPGSAGLVLVTNDVGVAPSWSSFPLDSISATQGAMLYRNASQWVGLAPGTSGQVLTSNGNRLPPSWTTLSVNSAALDAGFGTGFGVLARDNSGWTTHTPPVATTLLRSDGTTITWQTFTNFLDAALGSTQGSIIYRAGVVWNLLPPGTSGQVLATGGAGANPSWTTLAGSGTVTSVGLALPAEFSVTNSPVTNSGTLTGAWATQTTNKVFAAPNGSTGVPTFRALAAADLPATTSILDSISTTQGTVLYRNATQWVALAPGTNGQVLTTAGASANPSWTTVTGTGTVTSVGLSLPGEFTVSGSPVTGSGTLTGAWANQTTNKVLAAPNGSTGAPTFRALAAADLPSISSLLDGISSTQGAVLYRSATAWTGLGPGTSGQFLQTLGAGANPQWASSGAGGFPSGTAMLFQQTSAPTGWTKQTTHNDKLLRVVSGTASSGGSNAFSTVNAQTVVGSTTLGISQIPSHAHSVQTWIGGSSGTPIGDAAAGDQSSSPQGMTTAANGSGGSHNHTISLSIQYVDLIIATAN